MNAGNRPSARLLGRVPMFILWKHELNYLKPADLKRHVGITLIGFLRGVPRSLPGLQMNKARTQGRQRKMPSYSNNDHKRVSNVPILDSEL